MRNKTIINIVIGASSLKIIHCEKQDTDIVVKNSVILETNSNLFLNKDKLNIGFIEDKLRVFFFENKIKNGKICFILPDYMVITKSVNKPQLITRDYISSIMKTKQLHELIDENLSNEESLIFDCQVVKQVKFSTTEENDGSSDIVVSYIPASIIKSLKAMSKRLKMVPAVLEPETNGYVRLIDMFDAKDNYMIIDIGEVYTKIVTICGTDNSTPSIDYQYIPSGIFTIDGLITKLFKCPPSVASQIRITSGLNSNVEVANHILSDVVRDVFSMPILEHLNNIQNTYGGLQFINNFFICGGAWSIPGFKQVIEESTLAFYNPDIKFSGFSQFTSRISFDNDIVKNDILSNINLYASCIGLSLRGGI